MNEGKNEMKNMHVRATVLRLAEDALKDPIVMDMEESQCLQAELCYKTSKLNEFEERKLYISSRQLTTTLVDELVIVCTTS